MKLAMPRGGLGGPRQCEVFTRTLIACPIKAFRGLNGARQPASHPRCMFELRMRENLVRMFKRVLGPK